MKVDDVIRAWKDEEYRRSLSDADRSMLPENPAGLIELSDEDLGGVDGGTDEFELEAFGTTTITTTIGVTYVMSCTPACSQTMWRGTCAIASVGCCPPA